MRTKTPRLTAAQRKLMERLAALPEDAFVQLHGVSLRVATSGTVMDYGYMDIRVGGFTKLSVRGRQRAREEGMFRQLPEMLS